MPASVLAVHSSPTHSFSKASRGSIRLIKGVGVEGDAHAGARVKHRYLQRTDPSRPNLRQVHLIHAELFGVLAPAGFVVGPGELGENVTTEGLDLLGLPAGARLAMGDAVVTVTGLREPCRLIDGLRPGLMEQLLRRGADGRIEQRLAGVMGVVSRGGVVSPGDAIVVDLPAEPRLPLPVV